jgi:hypothetical protein
MAGCYINGKMSLERDYLKVWCLFMNTGALGCADALSNAAS